MRFAIINNCTETDSGWYERLLEESRVTIAATTWFLLGQPPVMQVLVDTEMSEEELQAIMGTEATVCEERIFWLGDQD